MKTPSLYMYITQLEAENESLDIHFPHVFDIYKLPHSSKNIRDRIAGQWCLDVWRVDTVENSMHKNFMLRIAPYLLDFRDNILVGYKGEGFLTCTF